MSELYNVAASALLHNELHDNYWKDKAKKIIKDNNHNILKALSLCFSRLEYVVNSDLYRIYDQLYIINLVKAASTLHTWLLDILKELDHIQRIEMTIRVTLYKGIPIQSVNKNILSYLRPISI